MQQQNTQKVEASKVPEYIKESCEGKQLNLTTANRSEWGEKSLFDLQSARRSCGHQP